MRSKTTNTSTLTLTARSYRTSGRTAAACQVSVDPGVRTLALAAAAGAVGRRVPNAPSPSESRAKAASASGRITALTLSGDSSRDTRRRMSACRDQGTATARLAIDRVRSVSGAHSPSAANSSARRSTARWPIRVRRACRRGLASTMRQKADMPVVNPMCSGAPSKASRKSRFSAAAMDSPARRARTARLNPSSISACRPKNKSSLDGK